jgi:hypothetical protein
MVRVRVKVRVQVRARVGVRVKGEGGGKGEGRRDACTYGTHTSSSLCSSSSDVERAQ